MLVLGLLMIVFVPIFKTVTHLPPYVGMMLSLSIVALVAEFISSREFSMTNLGDELDESHDTHNSPTFGALSKIEMPSILFFLGILMTVAAMESLGLIFTFGQDVVESGMPIDAFITLLGAGSAVIDNVPLVAASMGMEKISFFWYLKKISLLALVGYLAGAGVFLLFK
jgi:Na+/H+ antiporter NhaD/arsenite permease-like protein